MNPFKYFKHIFKNSEESNQLLKEVREGVANHADLTNRKMSEIIHLLQQMIKEDSLDTLQLRSPLLREQESEKASPCFKEAISNLPLLIADKTYNTSHPDYDATLVNNYPGLIFNGECPAKNAVYQALMPMMKREKGVLEIPDASWQQLLDETMNEIKEIPHSSLVFERKAYIEKYTEELHKRYQAHYMAGWVNLEDALFLYWLVRKLKPKTIVQTGVCNGLSSAFMMLGLVKNGPEGRLYVIDLPAIFNPDEPAWTIKDKIYGVMIPEGKSSGWMVPEAYRDRFEVLCGDAKLLLPPLVDKLDSIDMFYHDSDHTYAHMMFEFNEVKRKLTPGGLIVGDDISWNASLWDFADAYRVPAYNYKGAVGTAFF